MVSVSSKPNIDVEAMHTRMYCNKSASSNVRYKHTNSTTKYPTAFVNVVFLLDARSAEPGGRM